MNQKARTTMDEELRTILKYLRLGGLLADWDGLLAKAGSMVMLVAAPAEVVPTANTSPPGLPLRSEPA